MKIHWKLIIYQNFRVVFQISRPGNIPQKWFSTQNEPLGVTFQMRLTPTMEASNFWRNQAKSTMHPFKNTFKGCTMLSVWFFKKWKDEVGDNLLWKRPAQTILSHMPVRMISFIEHFRQKNPSDYQIKKIHLKLCAFFKLVKTFHIELSIW